MSPRDHYRSLTLRLLEAEAWGTLSEAEDESLRDQMDAVWWALSQAERDEADAWLAEQRAKAPDDLGLVEINDDDASVKHRGPRAA